MEKFLTRMNVDEIPRQRKQELLEYLVKAIYQNRIIIKPHHDKALGYFIRETLKNKGNVVKVKVPRIVLTFANTAWEALCIQKRKYFLVNEITDDGVYGFGVSARPRF